jgi:hypothetical protein
MAAAFWNSVCDEAYGREAEGGKARWALIHGLPTGTPDR